MEFDNTGQVPIQVPGFNNVPVNTVLSLPTELSRQPTPFRSIPHGWSTPRLTMRERAMLQAMNHITDQYQWSLRVRDAHQVAIWRQEVVRAHGPLISEATWTWIVAELQDAAARFDTEGWTLALATSSPVAKTDQCLDSGVHDALRTGVLRLLGQVQPGLVHHVDPSEYPLVYGRTDVLSRGGTVNLRNVLASSGRGSLSTIYITEKELAKAKRGRRPRVSPRLSPVVSHPIRRANYRHLSGYQAPDQLWPHSRRFQWLPCEVEFGACGTDVHITSYVNNLHPEKSRGIYSALEALIGRAIPLWNQVLVQGPNGRHPRRIRASGPVFDSDYPEWYYELSRELPHSLKRLRAEARRYISQPDGYLSPAAGLPSGAAELSCLTNAELLETLEKEIVAEDSATQRSPVAPPRYCSVLMEKWRRLRKIVHPEPNILNFPRWRATRDHGSSQGPAGPFEATQVTLQDTYRSRGLQVVIRISSVELTPATPTFSGEAWHIDGSMNEHIVATAIYYLDTANVQPAALNFRETCAIAPEDRRFFLSDANSTKQDGIRTLMDFSPDANAFMQGERTQTLGGVQVREGRMVAYPNTLQTAFGPVRLADPARPGHLRFAVLSLVDPEYRVCSTRNVPPQRHDWWAEEAFQGLPLHRYPLDVVRLIADAVGEWPMGMAEAAALRGELVGEREVMSSLLRH